MRRMQWSGLFAIVAVTALVACEQRDETPREVTRTDNTAPAGRDAGAPVLAQLPEGVTQDMVNQGQQLYRGQGNCFTCHGMNAEGTQLAPGLRDQDWIQIDGSLQSIETVIRTGVATPQQYPAPMPAMGGAQLSDAQIQAIAAYVYAISQGN
jgi:cbb3-type cytochrome c oxidase subunit III